MTSGPNMREPFPPRLSMDEYVDFVEASLRDGDPVLGARQKMLEERVKARFCIHEGSSPRWRVREGD